MLPASLFILGTLAQAVFSLVIYLYIHALLKQRKTEIQSIYIPAIPIHVPCGRCESLSYPNYYITTAQKGEQVLCTACLVKEAQHLAMQSS
jgi:hypothetical protein